MHKIILWKREIWENQIFKIADKAEELVAEAVKLYPLLNDQHHNTFKDKNKTKLAWYDVAKEVDYPDGKYFLRKVSQNVTSYICILFITTSFFQYKKKCIRVWTLI